jgi:hypothetical protein
VEKNGLLRRFAPRNDGELQIGNALTKNGLVYLRRQACPIALNLFSSSP